MINNLNLMRWLGLIAYLWGVFFLPVTLYMTFEFEGEFSVVTFISNIIIFIIFSGIPLFFGWRSIFEDLEFDTPFFIAIGFSFIWGGYTVIASGIIPQVSNYSLHTTIILLLTGIGLLGMSYFYYKQYKDEKLLSVDRPSPSPIEKPVEASNISTLDPLPPPPVVTDLPPDSQKAKPAGSTIKIDNSQPSMPTPKIDKGKVKPSSQQNKPSKTIVIDNITSGPSPKIDKKIPSMKNSDDSEKWFNEGFDLMKKGLFNDAINKLDKCLKINPNHRSANLIIGSCLLNLDEINEAIKFFDKAIEIDPNFSDSWSNKGIALVRLNKYKDAINCFDEALKLKPNNEFAWLNKGVANKYLNNFSEALNCYDKVLEINPNNTMAWLNKSIYFGEKGELKKAIFCFDKILEINPNNQDIKQQRDVLLNLMKNSGIDW